MFFTSDLYWIQLQSCMSMYMHPVRIIMDKQRDVYGPRYLASGLKCSVVDRSSMCMLFWNIICRHSCFVLLRDQSRIENFGAILKLYS